MDWDLIVLSKEYRPINHSDFRSNNAGAKELELIKTDRGPTVVLHDHCIAGTPGSEFHPRLLREPTDIVLKIGTGALSDCCKYIADWEMGIRT